MIKAGKKRAQRQKEAELIRRAAAAGGKMEIVRRGGRRYYAFRAANWNADTEPVYCESLREVESFIAIDESLQGQA